MAQSTTRGLPISRLINVEVDIEPAAVPFLNFDTLLIIGSSDVIDPVERLRSYGGLSAVADDFATTTPEYQAAQLFFEQIPQPSEVFIGRWVASASEARLYCGPLTVAEQAMANWTSIANGSFHIGVGGASPVAITGLDFSTATTLDGVASIIGTGLTAAPVAAGCVWNGSQFVFSSTATGAAATVEYLTAGSGTDISGQLKGTAALAMSNVPGFDVESPVDAVIQLDDLAWWYGLMFAVDPPLSDGDNTDIAKYIQGASTPHVFGITVSDPTALLPNDLTSIGAALRQLDINRAFCLWSSTSPYAVAGWYGVAFTVNFAGANTTITMMWKPVAGILPEYLGSAAADALDSNNYNYYARFNIGASIIVNGIMCGGDYFDEIWGTDWLANQIQTDLFNLFYQTPKVPQTDPGVHMLVTTTEAACVAGVTNGLIAPGVWQTTGFGVINQGDYLAKGFYVYAPPVATQAPADRNARKSPVLQAAIKLAGAIHEVDVLVQVNR